MRYCSSEQRFDYAPPMLGNGDISIALDAAGTHEYDVRAHGPKREIVTEGRAIWWAGHRHCHPFTRPLFPFGHLTHTLTVNGRALGESEDWEQTLDTRAALMDAVCRYDGMAMHTQAFVHERENVVAIEKRFTGDAPVDYALCYRLGASFGSGEMPNRFTAEAEEMDGGVRICFAADGQKLYKGDICFLCDAPCAAEISGNAYTLRIAPQAGQSVHFYIILSDEDTAHRAMEMAERVLSGGYDALRADHTARWAAHHAQGFVQLPDSHLQQVYETAQYALKISTTKWSIPTCLNDCCWDARFFAFDEFFNFHGLLTSGHAQLARRVTDFRHDGLATAIYRASSHGVAQAHYPWETVETHEEAAPPGFYYDHIFHMANVALGQWSYVQVTGDVGYLREKAYPVMRACSEFYVRHMLYTIEDGKRIVGRCTDLERLGSSVPNAFMTTCGVIVTLRNTAKAAQRLGVEPELAEEYAREADALERALPQDGERYLPAPDCAQRSIGVFAGSYPYQVFETPNALLRRAFADYIEHESVYGNMYAMGCGVSTWYAAWKAAAFARLGDAENCETSLHQAARAVGCFGEIFEINEPGVVQYRPWFTTSGGAYMTAVNEALLQSREEELRIAESVPQSWRTFAFDLPAWGGRHVKASVEDGALTALRVTGEGPIRVVLPDWIDAGLLAREGWTRCGGNIYMK